MVKKIYAISLLMCILTFTFVKTGNSFPETTEIKILSEKTEVQCLDKTGIFKQDYECYEITHTLQCSCEEENMFVQHTVIVGIDYDGCGVPFIAQASEPVSFGAGGRFEWEKTMGFSDIPTNDKLVSFSTGQFVMSEMVELNPIGVMMPGMFYNPSIKQKWYFRPDSVDIWLNMTIEEIITVADENIL